MVKPPCVDNNGMKKGAWSEEEDDKLRAYIQRYGHWNWRLLPKYAGLSRCGKSCRLRWVNYLKPGVKRGNFTKEEEDLIVHMHTQHGNKWSAIAAKLPGRTDNEVKNFWHTRIEKRRKQNPQSMKNKGQTSSETSSKEQVVEEEQYQHSIQSFDINPPTLSFTEPSPVDSWPDTLQNDYFPPLPHEDFFYPEFNYSELSSSGSSYLNGLEWIGEDDHSIISSNYVAQPDFWNDSFVSYASSSQRESGYNNIQSQEMGGFYDPLVEYFDHGMNLFS